jgi:hypothetical protein
MTKQHSLIALFFLGYILLSIGTPICFSDCGDYIVLMGKSLFSRDYYESAFHMFRGWSVPVFFSLFGKYTLISAKNVMIVQTLLSFLGWIWLCKVVLRRAGSDSMNLFYFMMLSIFSQGYYCFNKYLISDSFALFSVLFYLSFVISFQTYKHTNIQTNKQILIIIYILLSSIVVSARDTNIIFVFFGTAFLLYENKKNLSNKNIFLLLISIIIMLSAQLHFSKARHKVNIEHIVVGMVLPDSSIRSFFEKFGMPKEMYKYNKNFEYQEPGEADIQKIFSYMEQLKKNDQKYYISQASGIYGLFLLTHPLWVMEMSWNHRSQILNQYWGEQSLGGYLKRGNDKILVSPDDLVPVIASAPKRISPLDYVPLDIKLLIYCCALLSFIFSKEDFLFLSVFISSLGLSYSLLGFFGDLWELGEMVRHGFLGSIIFNFGIMMILVHCYLSVRKFKI